MLGTLEECCEGDRQWQRGTEDNRMLFFLHMHHTIHIQPFRVCECVCVDEVITEHKHTHTASFLLFIPRVHARSSTADDSELLELL